MNLIQEFHSDHQKVVNALVELRQAIEARNIPRVREILEAAEGLVRPHFKFEELYLYPTLERFLGEATAERLLVEHDRIFRSVGGIRHPPDNEPWI